MGGDIFRNRGELSMMSREQAVTATL